MSATSLSLARAWHRIGVRGPGRVNLRGLGRGVGGGEASRQGTCVQQGRDSPSGSPRPGPFPRGGYSPGAWSGGTASCAPGRD